MLKEHVDKEKYWIIFRFNEPRGRLNKSKRRHKILWIMINSARSLAKSLLQFIYIYVHMQIFVSYDNMMNRKNLV